MRKVPRKKKDKTAVVSDWKLECYLWQFEAEHVTRKLDYESDLWHNLKMNKDGGWHWKMQHLWLSAWLLQNKPRRECQDNQDVGKDLMFMAGFVICTIYFADLKLSKLIWEIQCNLIYLLRYEIHYLNQHYLNHVRKELLWQ